MDLTMEIGYSTAHFIARLTRSGQHGLRGFVIRDRAGNRILQVYDRALLDEIHTLTAHGLALSAGPVEDRSPCSGSRSSNAARTLDTSPL